MAPQRKQFTVNHLSILVSLTNFTTGFFECLRSEEDNIQVTIVCPGFVLTELHDRALTGAGPLERKPTHFMRASECADIIIDAAANGKRLEVMTTLYAVVFTFRKYLFSFFRGKVGYYLNTFAPAIVSAIAKKKAESSVVTKKNQ